MKRIVRVIFWVVFVLSVQGCAIDSEQNFHFVTLRIVDAEVPETFDLNGVYDIQVTYARPNGCTFFEGFDVFPVENTIRNIVAIGSEFDDGETACTQAVENVVADFRFEVLYEGTYTFRFYNGDDAEGNPIYLEYDVQVNEVEPTN